MREAYSFLRERLFEPPFLDMLKLNGAWGRVVSAEYAERNATTEAGEKA